MAWDFGTRLFYVFPFNQIKSRKEATPSLSELNKICNIFLRLLRRLFQGVAFTRVFKFLVDGIVDGFCNVHDIRHI